MPARTERPLFHEEAEVSVLGAALIDVEGAAKVVELLTPAMMYKEAHRLTLAAVTELFDRGEIIDAVTVSTELSRRGMLERVGGHDYIAELMDAVPSAHNVEDHARIVRDDYTLRSLAKAVADTHREITQTSDLSATELLERAEGRLAQSLEPTSQQTGGSVKELLSPVFADLEKRVDAGGALLGVPTGFPDVDEMTGGWQKGDLVIIAGRPSMGKTAFAMASAMAAGYAGHRVAVFSLEMSKEALTQRMLCHDALVDLSRFMKGRLTDDDYGRLAQAANVLPGCDLWIEDQGGLSLRQLRAKVMRRKIQCPSLAVVLVDYIQLMAGANEESRQQEVSTISRGLKALAKETRTCVIALSQLSREPEKRASHRPVLSDLRESGSLEQDADIVAFLFRPEYYLTDAEAQDQNLVGRAELIIAKQRNGPTGSIPLFFRGEYARFESMTPTIGGSL